MTIPKLAAAPEGQLPNAELLVDWQTELQRRLGRAELLLQLGFPHEGFDQLATEVHEFNHVCLALTASLGRTA